jgi:D-alanyl-D-alanine dipeptidase
MTNSRRTITLGLFWLAALGAFGAVIWRRAGHAQTASETSGRVKDSIPELKVARQLIVVKTADWPAVPATIEFYERMGEGVWKSHAGPFPAVTGRSGLRWGLGLHGSAPRGAVGKREGDGAAPAGVFELDQAFGFAPPAEAAFLKMPYLPVSADLEGVDDTASRFYNRLVRRSEVRAPDWKSSEVIRKVGELYRWGVVVRHNWKPEPGFGSCIYLHIWRGPESGTSGCTAFAPETMDALLHWLDRDAHPLLVQLPFDEYAARKQSWRLP